MAPSSLVWVRLKFRVNELSFEEALIRASKQDPTDFQLVIEHRLLGSFALTEDFELELQSNANAPTWRKVQLNELKFVFLQASQDTCSTRTTDERERNKGLFGRPADPGFTENAYFPRIPVEGDTGHIYRATGALLRGGVTHRIVGGIGSRGQICGHATFLVDSLCRARILLCGAGFLLDRESKQMVVDSRNGWKIRLLEGRI